MKNIPIAARIAAIPLAVAAALIGTSGTPALACSMAVQASPEVLAKFTSSVVTSGLGSQATPGNTAGPAQLAATSGRRVDQQGRLDGLRVVPAARSCI